jgi:hypothetical protein
VAHDGEATGGGDHRLGALVTAAIPLLDVLRQIHVAPRKGKRMTPTPQHQAQHQRADEESYQAEPPGRDRSGPRSEPAPLCLDPLRTSRLGDPEIGDGLLARGATQIRDRRGCCRRCALSGASFVCMKSSDERFTTCATIASRASLRSFGSEGAVLSRKRAARSARSRCPTRLELGVH